MNITLGVYDLFAYTVPGSLYLTLMTYIAERLGWIDPLRILQANTALVIISAGILSYLLGHITYELGYLLSRVYGRDKSIDDARHEFVERVPVADGRSFLKAHRSVIQAAVELYESGTAVEIGRLRAIGLMLRNSAPVFVLGALVEVSDAASGAHPVVAGCCIILFLLAAAGCLSQSVKMRHWANMKTLELAYWVPDIDDGLDRGGSAVQRSQHRRSTPSSQGIRNPTASTPRRSKRQSSQQSGPPQLRDNFSLGLQQQSAATRPTYIRLHRPDLTVRPAPATFIDLHATSYGSEDQRSRLGTRDGRQMRQSYTVQF